MNAISQLNIDASMFDESFDSGIEPLTKFSEFLSNETIMPESSDNFIQQLLNDMVQKVTSEHNSSSTNSIKKQKKTSQASVPKTKVSLNTNEAQQLRTSSSRRSNRLKSKSKP